MTPELADLIVARMHGDRRGRSAKGALRKSKRRTVLARDGHRCVMCGCADETLLTLDHVIPRSRGGPNSNDNLQTLCRACNEAKADHWSD